ncbi:MAG: ATP-dependent RecD-like DNA helicase [Planctomycetes bacterium]|nr:ATP-dependent RecD-like DNA helicase [Planctomycetota bacterium]
MKGRNTLADRRLLTMRLRPKFCMDKPSQPGCVTLEGTIERFTFRNPDSGWAVLRLTEDAGGEEVTLVGPLAQLKEGQRLRVTGSAEAHPKFGRQVKVERFEAIAPSSRAGIEAYLASGLVKGVGPAIAKRIVDEFGEDTLRVIEQEPARLRQVHGLGSKKVKELTDAVKAQHDLQNVLVFLRQHGLGAGLAARIVKRYGTNASALVQANPYRLADDVIGVGFRIADRLAGQLGIAPEAPERLDAALEFQLAQAAREGHCYLPEAALLHRTAELIGCAPTALASRVPELAKIGRVARQLPPGPDLLHDDPEPIVYPAALAVAEDGVARALDRLLRSNPPKLPLRPEAAVAWFAQVSGMSLAASQSDAIVRALREPVSVITGGPGVGKTTIVRALVQILAQKQLTLLLAAPTGRAAKRLEESTGHAASTLHRLLEFTPGANRFARDSDSPLAGDMLVVDEASMLDVQLAYSLLAAVPPKMKVVFVGDQHQLPSVGPGNVLADIIASGRVCTTALTRIFRQQTGSDIVRVAHEMLEGKVPSGGDVGDFFFVEADSSSQARVLLREMIASRIPRRFGLDPMNDVQVLCPMYRGEVGADALNRDLQDLLNPGQIEVERGGKRYRIGDKVMQIRNDYDREVWNGDVGRLTYLDTHAAKAYVRFPDREHQYGFEELGDLLPAYAISVHRSQGSEYPAIIVPVTTDHFLMLRRSLLYTAITRGKKLVVVVGSRKALEMAVKNNDDGRRHSGLRERLRDLRRLDGIHPEHEPRAAEDDGLFQWPAAPTE